MLCNEINIRDPYVLVDEGKYYLYGTRGATCWGKADGFDVYTSEDMVHWDGPHTCFHNDGTFWADRNYWAPEVHPWRGKYYMFASFKNEALPRGTAILCADTPMGPFHPHSQVGLLRQTGNAWMVPSMSAKTENLIWCFAMNGFRRGMGKCVPCR